MTERGVLAGGAPDGRARRGGGVLTLLGLSFAILAFRVLYLALLSPYDLLGDEAFYWEWSRRLELSYYTKGPGVAWSIWAGTQLFGHTEFGVRIGTALAGSVSVFALGMLARQVTGDARVGLLAAASFALLSGYQALGILMTIDGPYVACWILSAWAAAALFARWEEGRGIIAHAGALGAALGVGFLYKYTILLLVPSLVWHLVARRAHLRKTGTGWRALVSFFVLFVVAISPVILWNQARGWPTVMHLLGHLDLKDADAVTKPWNYEVRWTLEYFGVQLLICGPFLAAAIVASLAWLRNRCGEGGEHCAGLGFCVRAGVPIFVFYLLCSLRADVEGNWPIAGYATLLVPAAAWMVQGAGRLPRIAWRGVLGWGLLSAVVLHFLPWIPYARDVAPIHRLTGREQLALDAQVLRAQLPGDHVIIADYYMKAALLAFYLPDHPRVHCASNHIGIGRHSSYDDFEDTDLARVDLSGRTVLLIGAGPIPWDEAFPLEDLRRIGEVTGEKWPIPAYAARFRK